ncbi:MAG: hypothetical protein M0P71_13165 [Melioribacteraceae bacterium]|jgi:hypothetical protein|nr:hypothetical protein [Melioribacteraceae bacterium]
METLPAERKVPTLQELIGGDVNLKSKQNDLNLLLNTNPPDAWLREHPLAKGVKYIPIERIEYMLTSIFQKWNVEIRQVQIIANSVVVTVRLYYQDTLSNEMLWQDGIGASPIQTDKGSGAMDWNKTKNDAVMKSAPAAESYAVKDAAEKIGKLFGKDMNRADKIMYDTLPVIEKRDKLEDLNNETKTE